MAFAAITEGAIPRAGARAGLLGLSAVLALLTYLMVERPLWLLKAGALKAAALCCSIGRVGIFGASIYALNGVPIRFPVDIRALAGISDPFTFFHFSESVRLGVCHDLSIGMATEERRQRCIEAKRPLVLLWGDSYTAALYPGLKLLQETRDFGIGQLTHGNAPPFFEKNKEAANDADVYALNVQKLEDVGHFRPELIILHWMVDGANAKGSPEQQVAALADTVRRVAAVSPTTRIAVIGPVPAWNGTLIKSMVGYWEASPTHQLPPLYMRAGLLENTKSYDDYMKQHVPPLGVLYISALDIMCNGDGCLTRIGRQLTDLTAIDFAHLTKAASEYLGARFSDRLWDLIETQP